MPDRPSVVMTEDEWAIVAAILRKHVPDHEVWAFGSRAGGKVKRYSDLDLVIIGEIPLPWAVLAELADDFSESDLPWRVDILDWASVGPEFRRIIEGSRVAIQPRAHAQVGQPAALT